MNYTVWIVIAVLAFWLFSVGAESQTGTIEDYQSEISDLEQEVYNMQDCIDEFVSQRSNTMYRLENYGDSYYEFAETIESAYEYLSPEPLECSDYM